MGKRSQSFWVETHVIIDRFFVRQVALIFRLIVGAFAFLAAVGFLAYC